MATLALLAGCATLRVDPLPEPLRPAKAVSPPDAAAVAAGAPTEDGLAVRPTPGVDIQHTVAEGIADRLGQELTGPPISVTFNDVPLVVFINEIFAERLGMSFTLAPGLSEKTDLVTLRLTEPLSPAQLFATARRVLEDYGIDLQETDGVLTFVGDQDVGSRDIPLLISGRALPEVPPRHRVVFQLVPMHVGRVSQVAGFLSQAFEGQNELRIQTDVPTNTMLLRGTVEMLQRAAEMVEVLDQPLLRGRFGMIIEPRALSAEDMAVDLQAVLNAEGYGATVGDGIGASVILLPLRGVGKLVAFATDMDTLDHVRDWALTLDTGKEETIEEGVFTYRVRHTQAESMRETLQRILGDVPRTDGTLDDAGAGEEGAYVGGERIVVDESRNMLLFRGAGKEWVELRGVIEQLDEPVPSVLIEALVAEITVSDEEESGIEFLFRNGIGSDRTVTSRTLEGLGLKAKALSMTLDSAGQTRAVLNVFYEDSRVAIRSSARLMVKSGETASFDAGNEIPTITQLADAGVQAAGSTNVLQQVSYRKTGVRLEIEPVVRADGLVDLAITQELSEARPTAATSLDGTPTILSRNVQTHLTLRDGGSLLMGGLVSSSQSEGEGGVPGMSGIPLLGRLFRKDAFRADRTELAILVIPYVVTDYREGRELTERIKEKLDLHAEFSR